LAEEKEAFSIQEPACGSADNLRTAGDRRRKGLPPLRYLVAGGRRRAVRRVEDSHRIVVLDRYSPKLLAVILGILFLSLLDAALTLYLVEHGASELNPVMDYFLKRGPLLFTVTKYVLTCIAVLIFLVLANSVVPRYNFKAEKLFPYTLLAFGAVVVWELVLIFVFVVRL
jgi:hypothetical protein